MSHRPRIAGSLGPAQAKDAPEDALPAVFARLLPGMDPALGASPALLALALGRALEQPQEQPELSDLARLVQCLLEDRTPAVLDHPQEIDALLASHLALQPQEVFAVVGLDAGLRLLGWQLVARGLVNRCPLHPRQVAEPLLAWGASAYVIAHNHPSGCPRPSPEDRRLSEDLEPRLASLGLRLVDHLVIARWGYASAVYPGEPVLRSLPWKEQRISFAGSPLAGYGADLDLSDPPCSREDEGSDHG